MIAYIDSSVVLRIALNQKNQIKNIEDWPKSIANVVLKAECLRTIDRLFAMSRIDSENRMKTTDFIYKFIEHVELIEISTSLLDKISYPLGLNLGTLDAIHLFSAIEYKRKTQKPVTILTHDEAMGSAARMFGFEVLGTQESN